MILSVWIVALIAALLVYHLLRGRAQIYWLLLLSYGFYAWWAWQFLPVLALLTVTTYAVAARIAARPKVQNDQADRGRAWLYAGVAFTVAMLALLRHGYREAPFEHPFAVLGLSFYSLQALAYLFDTHSGALRTPRNLVDYSLYLAYFPKLLAGPIERPQAFLSQLVRTRTVDDVRLGRSATLIAVGLTRKLVFADPLAARLPAAAFTDPASLDSLALLTAIVGFAFVLYNDFAGYTSIARGVSGLFGIDLSRNFAQPFFAYSFTNLWTRWHVSLSYWLRDYVYLPVSRRLLRRNLKRTNVGNLLIPPLGTMLVAGLWHGASAHMLLWGGLHGVYLVLERVAILLWPPAPGVVEPWRQAGGIVLVFSVSCLTFVALRLPLEQAFVFWGQLFTGPLGGFPDTRLLLYMLPSLGLDWLEMRHGDDTILVHWPRLVRVAALATAVLLWFAMYGATAPAPFVYQGF